VRLRPIRATRLASLRIAVTEAKICLEQLLSHDQKRSRHIFDFLPLLTDPCNSPAGVERIWLWKASTAPAAASKSKTSRRATVPTSTTPRQGTIPAPTAHRDQLSSKSNKLVRASWRRRGWGRGWHFESIAQRIPMRHNSSSTPTIGPQAKDCRSSF
jgi:hypothetical protein